MRPILDVGADRPVASVRILSAATTALLLAALATLSARGYAGWNARHTSELLLIAACVLPLAVPALPAIGAGVGSAVLCYLLAGGTAGPRACLLGLALHVAFTGWTLRWQLPATTVVHRSALRAIGRRFLPVQAVTQALLVLSWVADGAPASLTVALAGLLAGAGVLAWLLVSADRT